MMNQMKKLFTMCVLIFAILLTGTQAQKKDDQRRTFGDPKQKERIRKKTSAIYEKGGDWLFILTRQDLLRLNTLEGMELRAIYSDGYFTRVIAMALAEKGKYNVEFYLEKDALLFAYETFEYYLERAPPRAWRNFKGLAAWERRSYFLNSRIVYAETRGRNAPKAGTGSKALINTANRLIAILKKKQNEQKPAP